MARRQLGLAVAGAAPPSGRWLYPATMTATAATAVTSGQVTFAPLDLAEPGVTLQSLGCNVSTARSGGTATSSIGIYPSKATSGVPDCSQLLASGTITDTATGKKTVTVSNALSPGRYWGAFLYYQTGAPGTAPQFTAIHSTAASLPLWSSDTNFLVVGRFLFLTGETALPSTSRADSLFDTGTAGGVVVAARAV